jgi:hypothetical protein
MFIRKRTAALVATAAALLIAPAAGAHKPFQEPVELGAGLLNGCSFGIAAQQAGREYVRIFDSGRFTDHTHVAATLTNVTSGDSKVYRLRFLLRETADPETGQLIGQMSGRFVWHVAPGESGRRAKRILTVRSCTSSASCTT